MSVRVCGGLHRPALSRALQGRRLLCGARRGDDDDDEDDEEDMGVQPQQQTRSFHDEEISPPIITSNDSRRTTATTTTSTATATAGIALLVAAAALGDGSRPFSLRRAGKRRAADKDNQKQEKRRSWGGSDGCVGNPGVGGSCGWRI